MNDFTIIIPTYNNLELAEKAIQSVISQKDVTCKIVVTDDSTDNKIDNYCKEINNENLFYYHNVPSLGAVKNWNAGLEYVDSTYTIVMHHDECMKDTFYLKQIKKEFYLGYDVIVSNIEVYIGQKRRMPHFTKFMKMFFIHHPIMLFLSNAIGPCACLTIKSEFACKFNENLHWLVDVDWYYNNCIGKKIKYCHSLYMTSTHGNTGQITNSLNIPNVLTKDAKILTYTYNDNLWIKLMLATNKIIQWFKFKFKAT